MDAPAIVARISATLPDAVTADGSAARDPFVQVAPACVGDVLRLLRNDPDLAFDNLMGLTALDLMGLAEQPDLRVVYHLFSYGHRHVINVRVDVPRDAATLPTATTLWASADWAEREAFDLVGVTFTGHPNLKRLLLPPEWVGHPLRRDWKQGPTALGFPTTRRTLLDEIRESATKKE